MAMKEEVRKLALESFDNYNRFAIDLFSWDHSRPFGYTWNDCVEMAENRFEYRRLAEIKGEILLAHYYQRPEIQDEANFVGDSLGLGLKARDLLQTRPDLKRVRLSAVRFMGDTVKIILGEKGF